MQVDGRHPRPASRAPAGRSRPRWTSTSSASGDPSQWGYQVVVQSNEGFPAGKDLLTRKVNEYEGQHRFGGGTDGDCDPHVMDILAGNGKGDAAEVEAQHKMLKYECNPDGTREVEATPEDGAPEQVEVPVREEFDDAEP